MLVGTCCLGSTAEGLQSALDLVLAPTPEWPCWAKPPATSPTKAEHSLAFTHPLPKLAQGELNSSTGSAFVEEDAQHVSFDPMTP
eukprot:scaffold334162_cov52-Prasinocladus_malaysianus.AAC.1